MDLIDCVPPVFVAKTLRSCVKFADLSQHKFSILEKTWLCQVLSDANLNAIAKGKALSRLSKRHSIPRNVLQEWRDSYSLGFNVVCGYCKSDDCIMDSLAITKLCAFYASCQDESNDDFRYRADSLIDKQAEETSARRSISSSHSSMRLKQKAVTSHIS